MQYNAPAPAGETNAVSDLRRLYSDILFVAENKRMRNARWRPLLVGVVWSAIAATSALAAPRQTGLWDTERLQRAPQAEWGTAKDGVQPVYFAGEPYRGASTRVFAWYARPEGKGPFPAMVLLHGGGGKAFAEWARLWADRGYAALAIDLAGHGPDGQRLADGGPNQDDKSKFAAFDDAGVRDMWTYHAVADALLGHSLLAAQKEVDDARIGVTGISWGGYLTCIVAGVDQRLKVAAPVYGCGFIHENSCWVDGYFNKMSDEQRARWVKYFDPSSYLAGVSCPILFVNGTNDFAYPPDSYHKSYSLVDPKLRYFRITVNMPHGHQAGWAPKEIGAFVDSVLLHGEPLAQVPRIFTGLTPSSQAGGPYELFLRLDATTPIESAQLHYTTDDGPWQNRKWTTIEAKVVREGDRQVIRATMPETALSTDFFTVRDKRGLIMSSLFEGQARQGGEN